MQRHIFLVPGFFGFANLGDFAYWGPVHDRLADSLADLGVEAEIHCVKSLPTASLRSRTRVLLETIAATRPRADTRIHLIGHSTGGLDARLLLTPAVNLHTGIDAERIASRIRSSISIATPHHGAPVASFFTSLLGRKLLQVLSVATMAALRGGEMPLSVWARLAGLFSMPATIETTAGSLATQLYKQLLRDFDAQRREQVESLLGEVRRDQSLLTQLTVESMDLFNAAAGDREGVSYGSVVTIARPVSLASSWEVGFSLVDQAQLALYYSLTQLAAGYEFPPPEGSHKRALSRYLGELPDHNANDGIVPTLSQQWGKCIAVARADHLDIIGHHGSSPQDQHGHYDWLFTNSGFREQEFNEVWTRVAKFVIASEK